MEKETRRNKRISIKIKRRGRRRRGRDEIENNENKYKSMNSDRSKGEKRKMFEGKEHHRHQSRILQHMFSVTRCDSCFQTSVLTQYKSIFPLSQGVFN